MKDVHIVDEKMAGDGPKTAASEQHSFPIFKSLFSFFKYDYFPFLDWNFILLFNFERLHDH